MAKKLSKKSQQIDKDHKISTSSQKTVWIKNDDPKEAREALKQAEVVANTPDMHTENFSSIYLELPSLDYVYEQSKGFGIMMPHLVATVAGVGARVFCTAIIQNNMLCNTAAFVTHELTELRLNYFIVRYVNNKDIDFTDSFKDLTCSIIGVKTLGQIPMNHQALNGPIVKAIIETVGSVVGVALCDAAKNPAKASEVIDLYKCNTIDNSNFIHNIHNKCVHGFLEDKLECKVNQEYTGYFECEEVINFLSNSIEVPTDI